MKNIAPAAFAGVAMLGVATFGILAPAQGASQTVAAIFPPWWTARDVLASLSGTDASVLREGIAPTVLLLSSPTSDLPERLRAAGAFLVLDPTAAAGCLGLTSPPSSG